MHKILKHLSTEQILRFREVSKQAQQVAERLLASDSSKQITINHALFPPIAFIKKFSGIILRFDKQQRNNSFTYVEFPVDQLSHIKALDLYLYKPLSSAERFNTKLLLTQLQLLEVLKIRYCDTRPGLQFGDNQATEILQALPIYANLKKLHVAFNSQMQTHWDVLLKILPRFTKLHILHIEGSPYELHVKRKPYFTVEQFLTFTQILQNLTLLKKLCLYDTIIGEEDTTILGNSLSTLKNLRILNLKKAIMLQEDFQKLKELLPALQSDKSYEPIFFYLSPYFIIDNYNG